MAVDPALIIRTIAAAKGRPSVRFLDAIYGPQSRDLRATVASLLHGREVKKSDKEAQYGRLRKALLSLVGAEGNCDAVRDEAFERLAREEETYPGEQELTFSQLEEDRILAEEDVNRAGEAEMRAQLAVSKTVATVVVNEAGVAHVRQMPVRQPTLRERIPQAPPAGTLNSAGFPADGFEDYDVYALYAETGLRTPMGASKGTLKGILIALRDGKPLGYGLTAPK